MVASGGGGASKQTGTSDLRENFEQETGHFIPNCLILEMHCFLTRLQSSLQGAVYGCGLQGGANKEQRKKANSWEQLVWMTASNLLNSREAWSWV